MTKKTMKREMADCDGCDRTVARDTGVVVRGEFYCCMDCAEHKTCECSEIVVLRQRDAAI